MAKLEVISSSLVPMASTDTSPMTRLDLTPWDLQMLLFEPIQKGILFRNPQSEKPADIIHRLKSSLSRVLDNCPPLAGRLATENCDENSTTTVYFVDCNNRGAGFTHAVAANMSVSDILEAKYTPEIIYSFFPLNGARNFQVTSDPLFAVQITELDDGLFVGCSANHAVVDGTSFWHMVNSWSEISRGFGEISRVPSFKRDFLGWKNRPVPVPTIDESFVSRSVRPPLLERVFHFSEESLAKLKARANSEASGGSTVEISSFQALVAHLWRCVARCRQNKGGEEMLGMAVGARSRIPLPEGYFGNAFSAVKLSMSMADLLECGLGRTGLKLNAFVSQQGTAEAMLAFLENRAKNPRTFTVSSTLVVSSSPRFYVYGGDFGWGRPVAVRSGKGQKQIGKATLYMAAEAGGVDVEICLAPEILKALEEDAEFLEAINLEK